MNVKAIFLRSIRSRTLHALYAEMWRALNKPGQLHRVCVAVSPVTAKWLLEQLAAPRSLADVNGVAVSICDARIEPLPFLFGRPLETQAVLVQVEYYVPIVPPQRSRREQDSAYSRMSAWARGEAKLTSRGFQFLTR